MPNSYRSASSHVFACAGSMHDFQHYELGRVATRASDRHCAVGTDSPEAAQHFLSILDAEALLSDVRADPVVCYTRVSEHVSDIKWLNAETLLGATGKGNLKLFQFDAAAKTVKHIGPSLRGVRVCTWRSSR